MGWMDRVDEQHGLVRTQGIQQLVVSLDERSLLGFVEMAANDFRLLIFQAQAMQQFDQTRAAFIFDAELPPDRDADYRVVRGKVSPIQAFNWASCASLSNEAPPPNSNRDKPSTPDVANRSRHSRTVSSSSKRASATFSQLQPLSSSKIALARRATRCSAKPFRASAVRSARSFADKAAPNHP